LPRDAVFVRWQHAFQIDDSSHSLLPSVVWPKLP
jgi:hypothetical protein